MASNVEKLVIKLNEEYGEGTIHTGNKVPYVRKMLFGVPMVDYASVGGLHIGRTNEFVGGPGSLKSYLLYRMIARFQKYDWANQVENAFVSVSMDKNGKMSYRLRSGYKPDKKPVAKRAALVDAEGTYTKAWGEFHGIDNDSLLRIQPDSPNVAIDTTAAMLREQEVCLVGYDSASIIEMDDDADKSMDDNAKMGANVLFWSRAIRKIGASINANPSENKDATFILINSVYSKVGMVFGNPEVVRNGEQLRLAKSLSLHLKGLTEIADKKSGEILGRNVEVKCLKNKSGAQGRKGNMFYSYIDTEEADQYTTDVVNQYADLGVKYEMITKGGKMYKFEGRSMEGMEGLLHAMRTDSTLFEKIKAGIDRYVINQVKE